MAKPEGLRQIEFARRERLTCAAWVKVQDVDVPAVWALLAIMELPVAAVIITLAPGLLRHAGIILRQPHT